MTYKEFTTRNDEFDYSVEEAKRSFIDCLMADDSMEDYDAIRRFQNAMRDIEHEYELLKDEVRGHVTEM